MKFTKKQKATLKGFWEDVRVAEDNYRGAITFIEEQASEAHSQQDILKYSRDKDYHVELFPKKTFKMKVKVKKFIKNAFENF